MSQVASRTGRNYKESGMVAIMVTLILLIVISLIVLGFAQISRRNQRQALDRQLSTQAFYAAETGVNDAVKLIEGALQSGSEVAAKPDCASDGGGFYTALNPMISAEDGVEYTCLMVDPAPGTLVYSSIGSTSTVIPLISSGGNLANINLAWQSKDTDNNPADSCPAGADTFSPTGDWSCGYGVLRFDLVPTGGALSMDGLRNSTMTSFVVPLRPGSSGASSVGFATGGGNNRLGVECSNSECKLTINLPSSESQYHMRVSSIYKDVSLQISAQDVNGTQVGLRGAQALVDSTGKAQDVLRRIQVRVPLAGSSVNQLSDYAIQSTEAICKRFSVMDGFFQSDADAVVPGVAASTDNPLCN